MNQSLGSEEIERYSRQLILSFWSEEKQLALRETSVWLSKQFSETALYLAGAGFGRIFLEDLQPSLVSSCQALNPAIEICASGETQSVEAALCYADEQCSLDPCPSKLYRAYFEGDTISLKLTNKVVATTLLPQYSSSCSIGGLLFASSLLSSLALPQSALPQSSKQLISFN